MMEAMAERGASRTAVLVCQGRAVAAGRLAVGRFADPPAAVLRQPDEREAVDQARAGVAPDGWADRLEYEWLTANAEVMAPRTVAIDDAVRECDHPQVVVLGAGLDGRAWRMPELAGVDVYEVDHPASQDDKRARAGDLGEPAARLHWVPVDFEHDDLTGALDEAGHDPARPTTWVWEGVVAYLTPAEVEATATVVAGRSAPGSRLVLNYQAPSRLAGVGLAVTRLASRLGGRPSPTATEPRRSAWTPAEVRRLCGDRGLRVVRDDDLVTLAGRLGMPVTRARSVRHGRVAVADRP